MVRSKVKYELIADERARRETFKKRKTGFVKKLNELKMLCDVDACALIVNGDGSQSEVWPSPHEASRVIEKFKSLPSCSQTSHMINQSGFLRQNLSRLSNNLDKETKKVQSLRTELLLVENMNKDAVDVTDSHDLQHMLRMLERKIRLVDRRIEELEPSSSAFSSVGKEAGNSSHVGKGKQPM